MKQLIIFLFIVIISGCASKYEKSDLIGTWEMVSITDLETGEIQLPEVDLEKFVVDIRLDSLYVYEDDVYAWHIKGDSIFVDWMSFYIKELTPNTIMVVNYADFYSDNKQEAKFRRIN